MDTDFLNRLKKLQVKINQAAKKLIEPNEVKKRFLRDKIQMLLKRYLI